MKNLSILGFCLVMAAACNQHVGDGADATSVADASSTDTTATPDLGLLPELGNQDTNVTPVPDTATPVAAKECEQTSDCDDGIDCTNNKCVGGKCLMDIDDSLCGQPADQCHRNICHSLTGCATEAVTGAACSPGQCAMAGVCSAGVCNPVGTISCDDSNPCTDDECNIDLGCINHPNSDECQDGSDLTINDICVGGVCNGTSIGSNFCTKPSDCQDGDECLVLTCDSNMCVTKPGAVCDDGIDCTVDSCDMVGGCTHTPKNSLCPNGLQICQKDIGCKECNSNADCNDKNPCTFDLCDVDGQCSHPTSYTDKKDDKEYDSSGEKCDDENACTATSHCMGDTCVGEEKKKCDDGNICTDDYCSKDNGCHHDMSSEPECAGTTPTPTPGTGKEVCANGKDDDGDGTTDENEVGAVDCKKYYWDADGDGYGKPGPQCQCVPSNFWNVLQDSDCNDNNALSHPNVAEVCDGIDNNCVNGVDEGCPGGSTPETCNGIDDDKDGLTDEENSTGCQTYYFDNDGDGNGAVGSGKCFCPGKQPAKYVSVDSDCDDNSTAVKPGAVEVCGNSKDDNCNGQTDEQCGNGNGGGGGGGAKTCTLRLKNSLYQMNGYGPAWTYAQDSVDKTCKADQSWCENLGTLVVTTGSGFVVANAQCKAGTGLCGANQTWGVGALTEVCDSSKLQTLDVFDPSADCVCVSSCYKDDAKVATGGNPNFVCTAKP